MFATDSTLNPHLFYIMFPTQISQEPGGLWSDNYSNNAKASAGAGLKKAVHHELCVTLAHDPDYP